MTTGNASGLPNVAELLARVLARVPREQQPLLIAVAERLAAERYRGWAGEPQCEAHRTQLLACARREEEIAARVEDLYADAATAQRDILAQNPDLAEINRTLFASRPLSEQFAIQARGERLGAATWRAFAREGGEPRREVFESCARLEEQSAAVLESLLEPRR